MSSLGLWQSGTLRRLQVDCCNSWVLQHVHLPLALAYEVLDELVTLAINMAIPAGQMEISLPERPTGEQGQPAGFVPASQTPAWCSAAPQPCLEDCAGEPSEEHSCIDARLVSASMQGGYFSNCA